MKKIKKKQWENSKEQWARGEIWKNGVRRKQGAYLMHLRPKYHIQHDRGYGAEIGCMEVIVMGQGQLRPNGVIHNQPECVDWEKVKVMMRVGLRRDWGLAQLFRNWVGYYQTLLDCLAALKNLQLNQLEWTMLWAELMWLLCERMLV